MSKETEQAQELLWGITLEVLLPSGRTVTIREQNGDDDDVLSNPITQKDLTNQDKFIQGIVIKAYTPSGKLTDDDISKMLIKDKYFIMFASRIHSIGKIVKFNYDWGTDGGVISYEDDISKYIWDYSKELPKKGEEDYFEYRMEPYPLNATEEQTINLSSGKELVFNCLTIADEKKLLGLETSKITKNRELIQRNLKLKNADGSYTTVLNFRFFSKKDMIELHKKANEVDTPFIPVTEIASDKEGVQPVLFPIISSVNFFFPEEI